MTRFKPSAPAFVPAFQQRHPLPSYHLLLSVGITPFNNFGPGGTPEAHCRPPPGITRGGSSHENKNKVQGTAIMRNLIIGIALTAISVVIVGLAYIFIGGILLLGGR